MEVIGRNLKEEVMKVLERIDEGIELEEVRRLGRRRRAGEEMVVAKMKTIEQKARVMKEKGKLAGQKKRLEDDLTWRERFNGRLGGNYKGQSGRGGGLGSDIEKRGLMESCGMG